MGSYEPLTFHEVSALMADIQQQLPMATEFGTAATTPKPQQFSGFRALRGITVTEFDARERTQTFENTSTNHTLTGYLTCRDKLDNLHRRLNARVEWPEIEFVISNSGTRPATRFIGEIRSAGECRNVPVRRRLMMTRGPRQHAGSAPSPCQIHHHRHGGCGKRR